MNVHAVAAVRLGAYQWEHGELEFIAGDYSPRETGKLLCLNQPLGGDSAYVFHNATFGAILNVLSSCASAAASRLASMVPASQ